MKINKKNSSAEIVEIATSPEEEKIFHWVESKDCLGSWMPSKNASVLEKTKYQFSQVITRYQVKNNLSEEKIAQQLGLDKNAMAKLLRGYIENFSLDSLISYTENLHLPLQIKITEINNSLEKTL